MKKWCLFLCTYACVCLLAACAAIGGGSPSSEEAPPEEPQESTVVCRVISVLDGVVARIGLCILLGNTMGLSGFWLGNALAGFVTTIMAGVYYYSGAWKKRHLLLKRDEAPQ